MRKILGLDIGEKRIGVAIATGKIIQSFGVIENRGLAQAVNEISRVAREEKIEKIVIGIPKNVNTFQQDKIHKFSLELAKNLNLPILHVDETLTSKEAERILTSQKLDPRSQEYKQEVDRLAAKLILEQYLSK